MPAEEGQARRRQRLEHVALKCIHLSYREHALTPAEIIIFTVLPLPLAGRGLSPHIPFRQDAGAFRSFIQNLSYMVPAFKGEPSPMIFRCRNGSEGAKETL